MKLYNKDFCILLQNLLNRATELEIYNAGFEKRKATPEGIEANLKSIGDIAMKRINAYENPETATYTKSPSTINVKK